MGKGHRRCEVCGIREAWLTGKKLLFSKFPIDPNRCREWLKVVGNEELVHLPLEKLHEQRHVCANHFRNKDFNKKGNRLKRHAIPTLNLMALPLTDAQLAEFPLYMYRHSESKESCPPATEQNENVQEVLSDLLPEAVPSTSRKSRHVLMELSQNDLMPEAVPSTSQQSSCLIELSQNDHLPEAVPSTSQQSSCLMELSQNDHLPEAVPSTSQQSSCLTELSQNDHLPEAVPSTSQQSSRLMELSQNDHLPEAVPSTSQQSTHILELSQNEGMHTQKRETDILKNKATSEKLSEEKPNLTPREKLLMEQLQKTKCSLASLRRSASFLEKLESGVLKEIVTSALKNQKRKLKGRRWTTQNKIAALAIYKRSPKAYRYLQHLMPLPSIKTLYNVLKKNPVTTGVNKAVIEHLKKNVVKKDVKDRYCGLVFDEIALKRRLFLDISSDKVEGYEDFGLEAGRSSQLADHALVFMLQGVRAKFKQPIAFYFVKGTVSSQKLASIIKEIITIVEDTGFNVITTICDQGPTNMGALKLLKSLSYPYNTNENYFTNCNGKKVYIIYDVPHLFKSIRNNFHNYGEMSMCGMKAKWEHLVQAEELNRKLLYLSKLTQMHVQPKYRAKMKVKYAAQILSNTVAAVVKLMAQSQNDPLKSAEMMQTGTIINDLDRLFDKTNGPSCPENIKRGLRENVSDKTDHVDAWVEYRAKLETVVFKNSNGIKAKNVRCIEGYLTTLKSLRDIWMELSACGFQYLNLRQLNQDALENLFGVIRQHSPTNRNPTCYSFIAALKTAIISKMTAPHSRGSNCEKDFKKLLTDFHDVVFDKEDLSGKSAHETISKQVGLGESVAASSSQDIPMLSIPEEFETIETNLAEMEQQHIVYVSGYIASIILKNYKCDICKKCLKIEDPDDDDPMFSYIQLREWWPDKLSLTYPTKNLCRLVEAACNIFESEVLPCLHYSNICQLATTIFMANCDAAFIICEEHKDDMKNAIFNRLALLLIRRQCQRINQNIVEEEETVADYNKRAQQQGIAK